MKKFTAIVFAALLLYAVRAPAQDLGPPFKKIKDGIYVYVGKDLNSNCGIVLTQEGVVLIAGQVRVNENKICCRPDGAAGKIA